MGANVIDAGEGVREFLVGSYIDNRTKDRG